MKVISGYVQFSEQMVNELRETEEAIQRRLDHSMSDPGYAAKWEASVDWDLIEDGYR